MNVARFTTFLAILLIAIIAVAACAPAPAPAPTAAPPTAAPAAPTSAPVAAPSTAPTVAAVPASKNAVVDVASNAALGKFLVDGAGMTLYMYPPDKKGDSVCVDDCAKRWPIFTTETGKIDAKSSDIKAS